MPEAISAPIYSTPCSGYFETQGREFTPDLTHVVNRGQEGVAAPPAACDEVKRHCCHQVFITTKQSGRNNCVSKWKD
jgi:hypothetical protein